MRAAQALGASDRGYSRQSSDASGNGGEAMEERALAEEQKDKGGGGVIPFNLTPPPPKPPDSEEEGGDDGESGGTPPPVVELRLVVPDWVDAVASIAGGKVYVQVIEPGHVLKQMFFEAGPVAEEK